MRRRGVIVSLEGHGGDELLAGYGLHILLALMRSRGLLVTPRRTLDLIDTLQNMYGAGQPERPNKAVVAMLTIPAVRAVARHLRRSQRTLADTIRRHSFDPSTTSNDARVEEQAIAGLYCDGSYCALLDDRSRQPGCSQEQAVLGKKFDHRPS
jgi:asparagine synthetase B (glutamine-hydrolysing)